MRPEELEKSISSGTVGPLYYLYGDEPYLASRAESLFQEKLISPDFRDFNLSIFYGNECKGGEIVESALTLPFFTDRRLVLVRRAGDLPAAAYEILVPYLQQPSDSTCLVFVGEKIDLRRKFFVEFKSRGELVEYKKLYEDKIPGFVRGEMARCGKRIDGAAADLLVYLAGTNLRELSSQVEKLVLYVGSRDTITADDVREIVSDTRVETVFALANALGERNISKALRSLHTILGDGEAPLMVLFMLTKHFRQLWTVREMLNRKQSPQDISRATRVPPFFVNGIIAQAKGIREREFIAIFERLFAIDLAMKRGGDKTGSMLEQFIIEVCGRQLAAS
jgi:DNA polymerase-3 subunit delta